MAVTITNANQVATLNGVKVLCYGRAGGGKTLLVATAPQPILISAEAGLLSLRKDNIEKSFGVGAPGVSYDIPVIEVNTLDDLVEAELYLRTDPDARKWFKTVCIDSITEIAEKVLHNAKSNHKDPRKAYGDMQEQMVDTIKKFRDLVGYNVYVTAKEEKSKDEGTGLTLFGPSMPGAKLGPQLPYLFDEVFNLNVGTDAEGKKFRYLRTQPDLQYDAKDRSGALNEIEVPHLGQLFSKIVNN